MTLRAFALLLAFFLLASPAGAQPQSFAHFTAALWPDAHAKGITRQTFDRAMHNVTPDKRVIAAIHRQPEYGKPFGDYVNALVSRARVVRGQTKAHEWAKTFGKVETTYRVERWVLLALWGMETDYGAARDRWDVFRSLATLAFIGYRAPYFRNELIVAMGIMQRGRIPRGRMVSSWAGAMGQTQFMPSNYVDYAIDGSGDGRADIWSNVPDVLASTANYLHKGRWQYGLPWGFEVHVPQDFDYRVSRDSFAGWRKRGVHPIDGKTFPRDGHGILFFPAGAKGPAFIATANYAVLKEYNNSDAYAVAVGHLADRLAGGPPIQAVWPAGDHQLSRPARIALQKKLAALGYKVNDFEGHIDFDLCDNIRAEQAKFGMVPDGNPTSALLARLGIDIR
ncbi:MAG TPA: lytic murein transglycosylase [Pseudolabrys sp.]|nr:lytic murein transglycosylase [Pseudolabrys sp.]